MSEPCAVCGLPLNVGEFPCISTIRPHARGMYTAIGDECDVYQENFSKDVEHFTSKQAMARRAKELGLMPFVRHVGDQGSDKSSKTSRWV